MMYLMYICNNSGSCLSGWFTFSYLDVPISDSNSAFAQVQSLFLNKIAGLRPASLLKTDSDTVVFLWILWNFEEHFFCRTPPGDYFCSLGLSSVQNNSFIKRVLRGEKPYIFGTPQVQYILAQQQSRYSHC